MQAAYYTVIFVIKNRIFYCVVPLIKIKKRYSNFCGYKSRILTNFLEDLLTKVKKKIQKFKQHKNGAPKQATLHLKFQMVAVRRC